MKQQVFVKINEYDEIVKLMDTIKQKVRDAKVALQTIKELKSDEDSELDLWSANLDDIQNKIIAVDAMFSGSDQGE